MSRRRSSCRIELILRSAVEGEALDDAPEVDDISADLDDAVERLYKKTPQAGEVFTFEVKPEFVKMKYAFDIKGIPREESNWVEVSYPYSGSSLVSRRASEMLIDRSQNRNFRWIYAVERSVMSLERIRHRSNDWCSRGRLWDHAGSTSRTSNSARRM